MGKPWIVGRLCDVIKCLIVMICASGIVVPSLGAAQTLDIPLFRGPMADYGASPWYVYGVGFGQSELKLTFDTGANFLWATTDQCTTPSCNNHQKIDTTQAGFQWIDQTTRTRSFGLWGDMETWTGKVLLTLPTVNVSLDEQLFAAIDYKGRQFGTLAWDGGVGFPSESSLVEPGSTFLFRDLYYSNRVGKAEYGFFTDPDGVGYVALGGDVNNVFDPATEVRLEPKKSSDADDAYLWGTKLHTVLLGATELPGLQKQILYLDTGSSRFKGDANYVYPILDALYALRDPSGNPIFEKYRESDVWTGLSYITGGPDNYPSLPNLSIVIGQSCKGSERQAVQVSLRPSQYSYMVDAGDRQGKYVIAIHRLDGIGGLLVGSTFMDHIYTRFTHDAPSYNVLTQSDMFIYQKTVGSPGPATYECKPL